MIFRLRHSLADSPPYPAESDSLSYGLPFRFRLLSTPFRNDAVTFSYDVMAYADRDFHPIDKLPLWAHGPKVRLFRRGLYPEIRLNNIGRPRKALESHAGRSIPPKIYVDKSMWSRA